MTKCTERASPPVCHPFSVPSVPSVPSAPSGLSGASVVHICAYRVLPGDVSTGRRDRRWTDAFSRGLDFRGATPASRPNDDVAVLTGIPEWAAGGPEPGGVCIRGAPGRLPECLSRPASPLQAAAGALKPVESTKPETWPGTFRDQRVSKAV